jgi:HlyD family secretion protein
MKPEGETVQQGDLVVLFDTANLNSQIEQEKVNLRQSKDKAVNQRLKLEQQLIDAEHALIKAKIELKQAELIANVPAKFRSNLEEDNIRFDLKKSRINQQQSTIKLQSAQSSLEAENVKQAIEARRIGAVLAKKTNELEYMQLKAVRTGTVLHALHPWNGNKISEGQSVQTSWNVASIPGVGNESVQAWVNEVDWPRIAVGQIVKLTLDAYPDEPFEGKIEKIGLQAESKRSWGKANYYDVDIQITQPSRNALIPGMSVLIETNVAISPDGTKVVRIIDSALSKDES